MMERWDIYWADCPHEEISGETKRRPVIIAKDKLVFVLALKVTTHEVRANDPDDYELQYWAEAGLSRPSVVRVGKIVQIKPECIYERIGRVQAPDMYMIQNIMIARQRRRQQTRNLGHG